MLSLVTALVCLTAVAAQNTFPFFYCSNIVPDNTVPSNFSSLISTLESLQPLHLVFTKTTDTLPQRCLTLEITATDFKVNYQTGSLGAYSSFSRTYAYSQYTHTSGRKFFESLYTVPEEHFFGGSFFDESVPLVPVHIGSNVVVFENCQGGGVRRSFVFVTKQAQVSDLYLNCLLNTVSSQYSSGTFRYQGYCGTFAP